MIFNEKHKRFIEENAEGLRNEELTRKLNEKFGSKFAVGQVKKFKNAHHISSGLKSCNLPIGSERISKGYILVKVAQPNKWKEKHRVVFESMYGNIPTNHKIIFLDGDKMNCSIENLRLIKDGEMAYLNKMGYTGINKEFTETAVNLVKLRSAIGGRNE